MSTEVNRCSWCIGNQLYVQYHDKEWGVPLHDDNKLFELLILEGAQAGLSWLTVLKRREGYRKAFKQFDPKKVGALTEEYTAKLLETPEIIRNKQKIASAINNAKAVLDIKEEYGSLDKFLWKFVNHKPIKHNYRSLKELPASDAIANEMSRELRTRGFGFVGPTICYAFMQSAGMVNDHMVDCFRYTQV